MQMFSRMFSHMECLRLITQVNTLLERMESSPVLESQPLHSYEDRVLDFTTYIN